MTIDIRGFPALRRKLDGALDPVRELLEDILEFTQKQAQEKAKPHPADKGTLANTIKTTPLASVGIPPEASVFTRSPIAKTIEEGRRPGRAPPVDRIESWARGHGIGTNPWVIVKEIRRRGTRGVRFMEQAAEAARDKMPSFVRDAANRIERGWGR